MVAKLLAQIPLLTDNFAIRTQGLGKSFKDKEALSQVDLEVKVGELFGLIGPDGAGKTTIMQILAGVMKSSKGDALVLGKAPRDARTKIGYLSQQFTLYPELSVQENLRYIAGLHRVPEPVFKERAAKYLKEMGLERFSERLASQLSGGMKQKLALCCAIIGSPEILLLDEPTAGVDPLSRREFWDLVKALRTDAFTILLATPYWDEAERCDRIALLWDGCVGDCGSPDELKDKLGVQRLELHTGDNLRAESLLRQLKEKNQDLFSDLYLLGDRIELLSKDTKLATNAINDVLSDNEISIESINVAKPTIENVFYMHLKQEGKQVKTIPDMPTYESRQETEPRSSEHESAAISAEQISKHFGDFQAVQELNLNVNCGEIYGLLGANGAGKTTTIQMLCGLYSPSSGRVLLLQQPVLRSTGLRKRIGYMSQKCTLYEDLTVVENLEFYSSIYEIPFDERKAMIDWALAACGLEGEGKQLIARLPKGWKQRIAFAAAIMHKPRILFLDEPTSGVDPIARREIWQLIRRLAKDGTAIIVTTHFLDEAEYCNRLGLMAAGKIIAEGAPAELKSQGHSDSLEEAFIRLVSENQEC